MFEIANVLQPLIDASEAILEFWQGATGSWGVALVLLGFTIQVAWLPVTFSQWKAKEKLDALQPELKQLKEDYEGDQERLDRATIRLYKERKATPLRGCLPLLAPFPVLIAVFYLCHSQGFKDDIGGSEPFLFFPDLAHPLTDHPLLLAAMMVLSMSMSLVSRRLDTLTYAKNPRWVWLAESFVFLVLFTYFTAGFIVFYFALNVWGIGEQLVLPRLRRPTASAAAGA